MASALLTVGITCFREGPWLSECWESLLAQRDDRWAAVVVLDGGGDDATRAVFEGLDHPRLVKHAMAQNVGPYPVRNKAFALTQTPYHLYLDGDDQLTPDAVGAVLGAFAANPEAGFVYGDYELFGERTGVQRWNPHPSWDDFVPAQPTPGPCAYKKSLWLDLGGYPAELARGNGDYDLLIGAAERGVRGVHVDRPFYRHRVGHGRRVSGSYERRYWQTHEIMVARHPVFFADAERRRGFLAVGYRRSVEAALTAGAAREAASVAARALAAGVWRSPSLWAPLVAGSWRGALRYARSSLGR